MTEAHIGCTEDEQLRWLAGCWAAVETLGAEGAPFEAVTPWALFGSVDWSSLLTRRAGDYEPGAFDIRAPGRPRPTLLAEGISALGRHGRIDHPLLETPGWWALEDRVHPELRQTG